MSHARWRDANSVKNCMKCNKQFGFMTRKNNCRACGDVFCKGCLPKEIKCTGYTFPEVACVDCVAKAEGSGSQKTSSAAAAPAKMASNPAAVPSTVVKKEAGFDAEKIQTLCATFQPQIMNNATQIAKVARIMSDQATTFVPPPFNGLCVITSSLLSLAENCVVNTAEACRMADRVARITFSMLQLAKNPGNFEGAQIIVTQLSDVFNDAIKLLKEFQPDSAGKSFLDTVKAKITQYSSGTVNKFAGIHDDLTMIMQDRMFVASVASENSRLLAAPTMEQIQSGIQSEVAYVLQEMKKDTDGGSQRLSHIEEQLQTVLDGLSNGIGKKDISLLDPRSVQIDISKVLGRGASGSVFAGTLYGKTDVAVKVLLHVPPTEEALNEVKHELEYTIRVSHRNVIKVYGLLTNCEQFEGRAAVVMERLGTSLNSVCGKLKSPSYMKLTNDIIAGMARVHDQDDGVVHFDLKPDNIMLTVDGRTAKIVDFGVAQSKTTVAFASASDTARARGTVAYMAPEILMGTSRGFYCDVYSFAVMMTVLWTGKRPWQGFSDQAIITAVQQGTRPITDVDMIASGLPEPIVALIVACWDHSPGNRPSFKNLLQVREIDAFWEAPAVRWPQFLQQLPAVQVLMGLAPSAGGHAEMSVMSERTFNSATTQSTLTANTSNSSKGLSVGGASVPSFTCEQLCLWLEEDQSINEDVVAWLRQKKITGDLFLASGDKIIQKLRAVDSIDEWNVDALERCRDKIKFTVEQEKTRQETLSAARKTAEQSASSKREEEDRVKQRAEEQAEEARRAVEQQKLKAERAEKEAAEAIAAIRKEEELKRSITAAKTAEFNRCVALNMKAVDGWRNIWISKNATLIEAQYQKHYSPNWSGTMDLLGTTTFSSDLSKAKAHTYTSLKDNWKFLPDKFSVVELAETFIRFNYATTSPPNYIWKAEVRFDFESPGVILRSHFTITSGGTF